MSDRPGETEEQTHDGEEHLASAKGQTEVTNLNKESSVDSSSRFTILAQIHRLLRELDDRRQRKPADPKAE